MSELEQAQAILREDADEATLELVEQGVASGRLRWRLDPEVVGVVGVVLTEEPNRAVVVVYVADRDFETSEELYQ